MRSFIVFLILSLISSSILSSAATTSNAVKGARKRTGTSLSSSSSSYLSSLTNSSYDRTSSPYEYDENVVNVYLRLTSVVLYSVQENQQLASYIATVNISWSDPRLAFDPEENGYNYTIMPSNMIWIPNVFCYNSIDVHRMDTEKDSNEVLITADGNVTLLMRARFDTICNCDISEFPFDTQYCSMNFDSGLSAIDRQMLIPQFQENYFEQGNAEWGLLLTKIEAKQDLCSGYQYSFAVFGFTLTRHSNFYVYFLIVPTFIITSTCIAGVLFPSTMSPGEKMSIGVAGLLGLTFLLSILVSEVPRAPRLPLLGKWVIGEMSFCVASIGMNAIGLNLNRLFERHKLLQKKDNIIIWIKFIAFVVMFLSNILFTAFLLYIRKERPPPENYDTM